MQEEFKKIDGYDNYSVSNTGLVRNDIKQRIMKSSLRRGYHRIGLCKDGNRKSFDIHRLVANAFLDNLENKPQVDHIDNNRTNNYVSNLRWVSNQENQMNSSMSKRNTSGVKGIS